MGKKHLGSFIRSVWRDVDYQQMGFENEEEIEVRDDFEPSSSEEDTEVNDSWEDEQREQLDQELMKKKHSISKCIQSLEDMPEQIHIIQSDLKAGLIEVDDVKQALEELRKKEESLLLQLAADCEPTFNGLLDDSPIEASDNEAKSLDKILRGQVDPKADFGKIGVQLLALSISASSELETPRKRANKLDTAESDQTPANVHHTNPEVADLISF